MAMAIIANVLNVSRFGFVGLETWETVGTATYGYLFPGQTDPDLIPDHSDRAVELLIEQFEKKPLITGMLRKYVDQIQEVEYELSDLLLLRFIENATGAQLDGIGDIVGVDRATLNDAEYKSRIYFQIFVNSGNGTPETVITALKFLTQASTVKYSEIYPAAIELETDGSLIPTDLLSYMQGIVPAAVRVDSITRVPTNPFVLGSETGTPSIGSGFSNTAQTGGGRFAGLVTT